MTKTVKDIRLENGRELLATECGPKTGAVQRFAERTGIEANYVSRILGARPSKGIGDDLARTIEERFGKPRGWMDTPRLPMYEIAAVDSDGSGMPDGNVMVQEVDVQPSAGDGALVPEFVATQFKHSYNHEWLRGLGIRPEDVRVMRVRGDSMKPTLWNADKIAVNIADQRIVDGRIYVIWTAGEAKVKRLRTLRDGTLEIISDNKDEYEVERVPREERHEVSVIGRVFDRSGGGGLQ